MHRKPRTVAVLGVAAMLALSVVRPLDVAAYGTFRQDQRINSLTMQFGTDSFATYNAFGSAFSGTAQGQFQSSLASTITSGATSLLFEMPGLSDLTGTNQASLQAGVVNGVPVNPTGPYNGNSDLDWWYAPRAAELDSNGVPIVQLTGSIVAKALTLGAPAIDFVSNLGSLHISSLQIAAMVGLSSTPLTSTGYSPPGHPASDQIDPSLQSFASMSSGQLKGNISAASLAAAPLPASLTGTTCTPVYTSTNSWLDVLVSGCTVFGVIPAINVTRPDQVDPAAPAAGAGAPYHLSANPTTHVVSTCTDKNGGTVILSTCLRASAYSSYFTFTTDRVIGKGPQLITFTSTPPANPMVGSTYSATATGGGSGNPVVFSADAASTPGACTVSSSGTVTFSAAGSCIVDADQAGSGIYFAAHRVQQTLNVTVSKAVLPAASNGAYGGYVTAVTIQNSGTAPANVHITYYDQAGAPVGAGDAINNLPVNGSWTVRQDNGNSFPSTGGDAVQAGSAVVFSDQPVAAFVNEFPAGSIGDATSYSGVQVPSGVGPILYAPTIVNNAYGGYTTGIGLLNEGNSSTNVIVTYRDGSGATVKTQTVTGLAAHAYRALYSGDTTLGLPSGFAGTATITSMAAQPLGAIVNETGPGGQFSSYDAVPSGSTTLNVPVALNNAFGGYYTGMGIQNTSSSAGSVTVTYYDAAGTPTVKNFLITSYGSLGVYQGSATDGPAAGAYTATITSTLPLAAIVNEVAPSSTSAKQSTSFNAFSSGSATLHLPLVENAGTDPWNTGEGIMNTGTAGTTVTVSYYNTGTGAAVGTPQVQTLAPHAFWGLYQPTGGLPTGTRATAVVTTSPGGQVAVICNESSANTFMSYNGQ